MKRLLNADIVDITPLGMNLDEELGYELPPSTALADTLFDAEFEDVGKESEAE